MTHPPPLRRLPLRAFTPVIALALVLPPLLAAPQLDAAAAPAVTDSARIDAGTPSLAAARLAQARFPAAGSARHAVLSRDDAFPDALAGTGLTGEGPLLFTAPDRVYAETAGELHRVLAPGGRIYLLGGEAALTARLAGGLTAAGFEVVRLAGESRVETALAVASEVRRLHPGSQVLLARAFGSDANPTSAWVDAVSGGSLAAAWRAPVLLSPTEALPPAVAGWLAADQPDRTVLLGGTGALSEAVASQVPAGVRVAGTERAATAAAVAAELWHTPSTGQRSFTIVPGERSDGWAFGLAAGGLAADRAAPLLLAGATTVPPATRDLVSGCGPASVDLTVVGSGEVVGSPIVRALDAMDGGACAPDGHGGLTLASSLAPFDSCDQLLDYYRDAALAEVEAWGLPGSYGEGTAAEEESGAPAPAPVALPASGDSGGVSGTNVQEQGVDEPDVVKTDGRISVTLAGGRLQVFDLTGAAPVLVGWLELPADQWASELLLSGSQALVFASGSGEVAASSGQPYPLPSSQTVLTRVDLTDPSRPVVLETVRFDGSYQSARVVDGVARVVLTAQPGPFAFAHPERYDDPASVDEAQTYNRRLIARSTLDDWLPSVFLGDGSQRPLLGCDAVTAPLEFSGLSTLAVATVDLAAGAVPTSAAGVISAGGSVYASQDSLYVTTRRWDLVEAMAVDGRSEGSTEIHAFDIADPAATTYTASGRVAGHTLDAFALSEHDGFLRIAVTAGAETSESAVVVLAPRDGVLEEVGRVGGLGVGEQIQAVRFLGDLGLVVTFEQVDPLYVLDLSDPRAPRLTGELKVPGFSTYLHRVAPDLILGLGLDATDEGQVTGSQASLFDISDRTAPERVAAVPLSQAWNSFDDYRSILYWEPAGLVVVPIEEWDQQPFMGAVALRVDPSGDLTEVGRLTHDRTGGAVPDGDVWSNHIRRSFVAGERLYTLSARGLLASDLRTLQAVGFADHALPPPTAGEPPSGGPPAPVPVPTAVP